MQGQTVTAEMSREGCASGAAAKTLQIAQLHGQKNLQFYKVKGENCSMHWSLKSVENTARKEGCWPGGCCDQAPHSCRTTLALKQWGYELPAPG